MYKKYITIPVAAITALGLSTNTFLANDNVMLIDDNIVVEAGTTLDLKAPIDFEKLTVDLNKLVNNNVSFNTENTITTKDTIYDSKFKVECSVKEVEVEYGKAFNFSERLPLSYYNISEGWQNITVNFNNKEMSFYDFESSTKTYKKLGTFTEVINFTLKSTGETSSVEIVVKVVDKTKPVLKGVKNITVAKGRKINLLKGVTATDNVDGNLTKKIKVSKYNAKLYNKAQKITYTVTDKSGNTTKKTVKLTIKDVIQKLDKYMYAKNDIPVRNSSSSKGKKIGTLKYQQKVHVTGRDKETGWYRISYKGKVGWVSDSYLATSKPTSKTPLYNNNSKKPSNPTKNCSNNCNKNCKDCMACDCACNNCERPGDCFDIN